MSSPLARFHALRLAAQASTTRSFSQADVREWCRLAGQHAAPAAVPEPLIAGMFSYLLGEELPGHGTNYLKQNMRFDSPAGIGEPLTATVAITHLRADKALVNLATHCTGEDGRLICSGDALVLFRR